MMKRLFYFGVATFIMGVDTLSAVSPWDSQGTSSEVYNINFSGDYDEKEITVSWLNPPDSDFESVELKYSHGKKKATTVEIAGGKRSYTLKGSYGKTYKFTLRTKDKKGNYSVGVTKKIYFGNFNPEGMKQFRSFDEGVMAILAGKLKIKAKENDLYKLTDADFKNKFSNLEVIEGKFEINNVDKLTSMDAFGKLKRVGGKIYIAKNNRLVSFCGLKSLVDNDGAFLSSIYKAEYNAYNPSLDDIKNMTACKKQ